MIMTVDHSGELDALQQRLLANRPVQQRQVMIDCGPDRVRRFHLLEWGHGAPVLLLHGSFDSALSCWYPLLAHLDGVRVLAPDRPGQGLSEPITFPRGGYQPAAVRWVDRLLDALELDSATVVGHSAGGLWALWYALGHPDRVDALVLIGTPSLPGTRAPLPFRLLATPALGDLIVRIPSTPDSFRNFARALGEGEVIDDYPAVIELTLADGSDPLARASNLREVREIVSPVALLTRTGFVRRTRIASGRITDLRMPTMLIWGDHDPFGGAPVARAIAGLIPAGRLEMLPGGHAPVLDQPERIAELITEFTTTRIPYDTTEDAMTQTSAGPTQPGPTTPGQQPAVPPTPEQTRAAWDSIADGFDRYVTPISTPVGASALDRITITDGTRFLDVAAGTGALSLSAARRGAQVTAVDISPIMIERLNARADAEGHRIDALVQNCHALDLADDTFDVVASQNGVTMAPIAPGLAEMVRVTRPGGTVLIAAFGPMDRVEFLRFYVGAIKAAVPGFVGPPFDPPPPPFQLADRAHFERVLTDAGLTEVQVDTVDWEAPFATGGDLWNEMRSSHPIGRQLMAGLSEAQCQDVRQVLDGMIAERADGHPTATLHAEVNVGIGTKPAAAD